MGRLESPNHRETGLVAASRSARRPLGLTELLRRGDWIDRRFGLQDEPREPREVV
jgi:hypothetical protein